MRKNVWKRILSVAAMICLMVCAVPAGVQAADSVSYVALGDSITTGYGLENKDTEAFPAIIAADKGYSVVNHGVVGATSATLLASLSDPKVAADVASADVISITIGGNDLMGALYSYIATEWNEDKGESMTAAEVQAALAAGDWTMLQFALGVIDGFASSEVAAKAVEAFTSNFKAVITAIRKANPDVLLFVATQYNPYKWLSNSQIKEAFKAGVSGLNSIITAGAGSKTYTVVDVYGAFEASDDNLSNATALNLDFHPNSEGHKVIASTFEVKIEDAILDVVDETFNSIANAVLSLSNESLAQADITSAEQAKAWAESQLKSVIPAGVSSEVVISNFVAATAGTAQNKAGTDGSFNVAVNLSWLGMSGTTENAKVSIQATAYTEPAVNPGSGDDGKVDADKQTSQTNEVETTVNKNKSSVPETGDTAEPMQYVVLILAAGIVAAAMLRRKSVR